MGCATSAYAVVGRKNKKKIVQESVVFVPQLRAPVQSDLQRQLKGVAPKTTVDRLSCLRNQIQLVAEDTGGSAISELRTALEEYLSLLTSLIKKKNDGMEGCVEFKWKTLGDGRRAELCFTNLWMEMLTVIHMMAALALTEANSLMIPKACSDSSNSVRVVSSDCRRDAVDLLLKASGYLEFCIQEILTRFPPDIKSKLPDDMQESVLQTLSIQALGQGTEIQLGLAVDSQKATLSVKRRLACEQVIYFSQAYQCLSGCEVGSHGCAKKLIRFIYWKFLEAKAAAYYYHGLVTDKGNEPACHVSAVCCFLAAAELLAESKKACFNFCLSPPVTRAPPMWGVMKHLSQKIPEVAFRKSQTYGYLLEEEEKAMQCLPELPDFQLSLRPEEFELPEIETGSTEGNQTHLLSEHLEDYSDNHDDEDEDNDELDH
ncbi:Endosomal targeting BRO1-like domain-containing protein [Hirschfeldia incana]|nr:Endosomal targeting BRO1-like domain-containing protein [Hirschfeldia incana]